LNRATAEYEGLSLLRVCFAASAIEAARAHAAGDDREVCGVCLGRVMKAGSAELTVNIDECWPAPFAESSYATVRFTYESWSAVLDRLEKLRTVEPEHGWRIVGWYHSHPGYGIFLSATDQHTHAVYFPRSWHIALVVDPKRNQAGVFARAPQDLALLPCPFVIS
jgi:proteasome lid subunit RPN8/RPN11